MESMEKTALITGGAHGIGKSIVEMFAQQGVNVLYTYHKSAQRADVLADTLEKTGVIHKGYQCDLEQESYLAKLCTAITNDGFTVDILVNNAGITQSKPFWEITLEDWDFLFNVNLRSAFYLSRHLVIPMMERRWGRILFIGSVGGERMLPGVAAHYAASKAGLSGLTRSMAKELARYNILVNCVAPGLIETEMSGYTGYANHQVFRSVHPMKRMGKPGEVAELVAFLASDKAQYITGETFMVTGGLV